MKRRRGLACCDDHVELDEFGPRCAQCGTYLRAEMKVVGATWEKEGRRTVLRLKLEKEKAQAPIQIDYPVGFDSIATLMAAIKRKNKSALMPNERGLIAFSPKAITGLTFVARLSKNRQKLVDVR